MSTEPTQNAVPSESPRDLKFNAGKIDEFVTSKQREYEDRFGNKHYTVEGLRWIAQQAISSFGYITMDSFQDGATLTLPNQVLRWKNPDGDGEYYRWDGEFPKNVNPDSTPQSAGGIGDGAWLSVGSAVLTELDGSTLGYRYQGLPASTKRTVRGKLDEYASLWDFHCDSNGNVIQPGPSVDSRQYIQNAIDYLADHGGGTLVIPVGDWYLNSYGPSYISGYSGIIHWKSKVNIQFEPGSKIKLTNFYTGQGYCVFCGFGNNDPLASGDLRDCSITGPGVIDCGVNEQPVGGALCYAFATGKSYNVRVADITVTGGDLTWAGTLGWNGFGDDTVAERIKVINIKRTDVDKNVDQTMFYVGCPRSGVRNCYMDPGQLAKKITAGVELHQLSTFCTDNIFVGMLRAIYVVMHSSEATGAGPYLSQFTVTGNIASITGQFITLGAESISMQTHITDGVIANNIATITPPLDPAQPIGRQFIASDVWQTAPPDSDTSRILVANNVFFCPTNLSGSAFFFYRVSTRGFYFTGNMMDCRHAVRGDGTGTAAVELRDIVWDKSNTFGPEWMGQRSGTTNLFEFYAASVLRCHFEIAMPNQDSSIANIVYAPPATSIDYSAFIIHPENIPPSVTALGVAQANKAKSTNYFSYPETVSFSCFNTAGAVFCFSTATDYSWCAYAEVLSKPGVAGLTTPGSYSIKDNGQLGGVGYNDAATARTWNQRVLLKSST